MTILQFGGGETMRLGGVVLNNNSENIQFNTDVQPNIPTISVNDSTSVCNSISISPPKPKYKPPSIVLNCPRDCLIRTSDTEYVYGSQLYQMMQDTRDIKRYLTRQILDDQMSCRDVQTLILDYLENAPPDFILTTEMDDQAVLSIHPEERHKLNWL